MPSPNRIFFVGASAVADALTAQKTEWPKIRECQECKKYKNESCFLSFTDN